MERPVTIPLDPAFVVLGVVALLAVLGVAAERAGTDSRGSGPADAWPFAHTDHHH